MLKLRIAFSSAVKSCSVLLGLCLSKNLLMNLLSCLQVIYFLAIESVKISSSEAIGRFSIKLSSTEALVSLCGLSQSDICF